MFDNPHQNIGNLHIGQSREIDFYYNDPSISTITTIQGCGCSLVSNLPDRKLIKLVYTATRIPKHLDNQTHWTTTKTYRIGIKLTSGEETETQVSFTVTVTR